MAHDSTRGHIFSATSLQLLSEATRTLVRFMPRFMRFCRVLCNTHVQPQRTQTAIFRKCRPFIILVHMLTSLEGHSLHAPRAHDADAVMIPSSSEFSARRTRCCVQWQPKL
jgi:hypothetical protein